MKVSVAAPLVFFVLLSSAFAQEESPAQVKPFYVHLGLGYANISYPGELGDALDLAETHIGGVGCDVGVYMPLPGSNKTIVGFDGNGAVDLYSYPGMLGESASMTMTHVLLSLSSMHFFKEIGLGPFVRADAGLSRLEVKVSDIFTDVEAESNYGVGLLVGGGIAFPILDKGKALLNVSFSLRHVEGDNYKILGLGIGFLY